MSRVDSNCREGRLRVTSHAYRYRRQGISLPALILFGVPHPGTRAASTGMAVNKFSSDGSVRNVECVSGLMANLDPSSLYSPRFSRDLGSVPSSHLCFHFAKIAKIYFVYIHRNSGRDHVYCEAFPAD